MLVNNTQRKIFLDNASTTPLDKRVLDAMMPYFSDSFGNASSNHAFGTAAKEVLWHCRETIAGLINCLPEEIIFTSSGTESNNTVIKGVAFANQKKGNHIIVSSIEHECILNACRWLQSLGYFITFLPVDSSGIVDIDRLARCINAKTILVSVMQANNEIGTIQPLKEIGQICKDQDVYFHTDACQSFGKIPFDIQTLQLNFATLNAHKIYGPKGTGALYVRKGSRIVPLLHGGGQEMGLRSSTENIPGIIGFAKAAELACQEMTKESERLEQLRDKLIQWILNNIEGAYLNGDAKKRLPTNINFAIEGLEGENMRLLLLLDEEGIAVSAGSACSSNDKTNGASHVLQAIGKSQFEARGGIRVSLGRFTTEEDIDTFTKILSEKIKELNPIFS